MTDAQFLAYARIICDTTLGVNMRLAHNMFVQLIAEYDGFDGVGEKISEYLDRRAA